MRGRRDLQDAEDAKEQEKVAPQRVDLDLEEVGLVMRCHCETGLSSTAPR